MMSLRESLPPFFGFEAIGILLRDDKTNELFSINETAESLSHYDFEYPKFMEAVKINSPSCMGVSGHVFKS
jgi:hypothetical protein